MPVKPIKQLGQHFLIDNAIAEAILAAAQIQADEPVWEIGAGTGVLTGKLLQKTNDLTAFEIDKRLCEQLRKQYGTKLTLINQDILSCNWTELLSAKVMARGQKVKLVANLPYQITSPVLYALEANEQYFSKAVLMLQKEVAQRLTAKAGTRAYGVLTLKIKYSFDAELLFEVSPEAFEPQPKVRSCVIKLLPRADKPALKSLDIYWKVIHTAFNHRRKTLRNNLRQLLSSEELASLETSSGIDFSRRGETVEESEFVRLADLVYDLFSLRRQRS
ncbi:MAG: 16S rRNA (adenine(1518)-N(6)/adenine(1519)-N(6))-dimethyltransferase RsmA [Candidatus Cloacimonadaceae bacterium]